MGVSLEFIKENYPVHYLVWENKFNELENLLSTNKEIDLEKLDPRGRTGLCLSVTIGHVESSRILLKFGANAQFEHSSGWNIVQESVCGGNPELLKIVLENRDLQKRTRRSDLVPNLLRRLKDAPDFFVEMKWEFTSWVPLITRMCPANSHRVYKMGSNVRVDSSVSDQSLKKDVTIIFQGREDSVRILEIDHETRQVFSNVIFSGNDGEKNDNVPDDRIYERAVSHRLASPSMISYVNLDKIAFERNKTGIWGWGSDKSETVASYDCKVFSATNVELITKIRHEHLSQADKTRNNESMSNLQRLLSTFASSSESTTPADTAPKEKLGATSLMPDLESENGSSVSILQYFDANEDLQRKEIGRPKEMKTKINKFKATAWLCENYPLNLQEQVMPILDIMALSSSQFSKLKDFIQMQIPAGFPVKIEIPIFHLVNACITFDNIFATERDIPGVKYIEEMVEDKKRLTCVLDENLFEHPKYYQVHKSINPGPALSSSEDDIFQWNSDDYTSESNPERVDIYEALNVRRNLLEGNSPDLYAEEQLLQKAIEESLLMARQFENPGWMPSSNPTAASELAPDRIAAEGMIGSSSYEELQSILDLSRKEIEETERLRRAEEAEEEEALKKILELSLIEK